MKRVKWETQNNDLVSSEVEHMFVVHPETLDFAFLQEADLKFKWKS